MCCESSCFRFVLASVVYYASIPMYFAQGYVSLRKWWAVGLAVSFVNLAIWGVVGFGWWKLIGIW